MTTRKEHNDGWYLSLKKSINDDDRSTSPREEKREKRAQVEFCNTWYTLQHFPRHTGQLRGQEDEGVEQEQSRTELAAAGANKTRASAIIRRERERKESARQLGLSRHSQSSIEPEFCVTYRHAAFHTVTHRKEHPSSLPCTIYMYILYAIIYMYIYITHILFIVWYICIQLYVSYYRARGGMEEEDVHTRGVFGNGAILAVQGYRAEQIYTF